MKYCAFLISAMMASVSAFAPSSKVPTTTALNQAIDYNPNLGGPTSSDPVDQTLMNMVRPLSFSEKTLLRKDLPRQALEL